MKQENALEEQAEDLEVMASIGAWDMVTWKHAGIAVRHEFFFINTKASASDQPKLKERIEQIDSRQMLGKGFKLKYFSVPEAGCHVRVQEGWQLTNPVQSRLFLEQFIKLVG